MRQRWRWDLGKLTQLVPTIICIHRTLCPKATLVSNNRKKPVNWHCSNYISRPCVLNLEFCVRNLCWPQFDRRRRVYWVEFSGDWENAIQGSAIQGSDLVFGFPSRRILDSFSDSESETMPRRPRLQFPGAIYHVVTRGDGRRALFHDENHYARATKGLVEEVQRSAWEVLAYCWMPNHWSC